MPKHNPKVDFLLEQISQDMKNKLSQFVGHPVSPSIDCIREAVRSALMPAKAQLELQASKDFEKWVTVRWDPDDRSKIIVELNDPYNAPTWLHEVFENYAQNGH